MRLPMPSVDKSEIATGKMSPRLSVIQGVIVSGLGNVISRVFEMGTAVLLLRWLTIFEFGVYHLAISAYNFGTSFFLIGAQNVVVSEVTRSLTSDFKTARRIFSVYILFVALVGMMLWTFFFFGSGFISRWFPSGAYYIKIVSFLFLLSPFETAYRLKFQIFLDFFWVNLFRVFRDISMLMAISSLWLIFVFGAVQAVWAILFATAMPVLLTWVLYHRRNLFMIPRLAGAIPVFKNIFLHDGKWAWINALVENMAKNFRPFLIQKFAGTEAVALISLAQTLNAYTSSLFPVREIFLPVFPQSADDPHSLAFKARKAMKYSIITFAFLTVLGGLAAPMLVYLLFPKYVPALPFFFISMTVFWLNGFRSVIPPLFVALRMQLFSFYVSLLRIATLFVAGTVLIYFFGIWGAAWEIVVTNVVITTAAIMLLKKALPEWRFSLTNLFSIDSYDRMIFADLKNRIINKLFRLRLQKGQQG